jgi:hypothetical protein
LISQEVSEAPQFRGVLVLLVHLSRIARHREVGGERYMFAAMA